MSASWHAWRATTSLGRASNRLGLGLIVGLALAMVAIPIAGARRTGSAYERFVKASDVAAVVVDGGDDSGAFLTAVAAIPGVVESARWGGMQPTVIGPPGNIRLPPPGAQLMLADARFGTAVSRHVVIDGAVANPDRLEVVVTEEWANRFGTRVGDEIALTLPSEEVLHEQLPFEDLSRRIASDPTASRSTTARVSGVVLVATEVAPDDQDRTAALIASPAIARQLGFPTEIAQGLMHVILSPDTDVARFKEEVEALSRQLETSDDSIELTVVEELSAGRARVERALGPHVTVLWVLAALAALLAVVVVVPAVLRQIAAHRHEDEVLTALGFTRRDRSVLTSLRLVPSALIAVLVAVVVTTLSSLWFPIGPVVPFEPDPGIRPDVVVLAAVALVALIAVLTVAAVRPYVGRGRRRPQAREGLADLLARRGAPPSVVVGARIALPGDGLRTTMRTSVMTLAAGLLVAGAVVWLAAGVDRLASEPQRQGWAWDLTLLNDQGYRAVGAPEISQLLDTAGAEKWALLSFSDLQVDGAEIVTFGVAPERGSVDFTMLEGRMPSGPDEVALGTTTLEEIGASIGDLVELRGDDASRAAMIVGRVVLPALAPADAPRPRLGGGAVISQEGLAAQWTDAPGGGGDRGATRRRRCAGRPRR